MAGQTSGEPGQPEAAPLALLEARGVAVLAAGADPGGHQAVDVHGGAEGVPPVSLGQELELLCRRRTRKKHDFRLRA